MATVAENLLALDAVKDEIKAKIGTNLGRTIGAAVPFTDYADYILPPVAWMPDPLWASLDDIDDGQIGMIVRDRDDLGVAARCAFTITATAEYVVDWGDGTAPETVASTVMADHTYTLGAGTPDSKGTTTFKVRISSTGTITRIQMASNITGGVVKQTVQSVEIKASGITTMASAFAYCRILQRTGDINLPSCMSMANAFAYCASLIHVGAITLAACTSMSNAFAYCGCLMSIGALDLAFCTTVVTAFAFNLSLKSVGNLNLPLCTTISGLFTTCSSLSSLGDISSLGLSAVSVDGSSEAFFRVPYSGVINTPNAKYTAIHARGASDRYSGITGLTFHPSSAFSGSAPQIRVDYTMMDRTALVALFNLLPTMSKTINITGAIGAADLTAGDRAIATGKGWTIVG